MLDSVVVVVSLGLSVSDNSGVVAGSATCCCSADERNMILGYLGDENISYIPGAVCFSEDDSTVDCSGFTTV